MGCDQGVDRPLVQLIFYMRDRLDAVLTPAVPDGESAH
jgi:hypothetical protein